MIQTGLNTMIYVMFSTQGFKAGAGVFQTIIHFYAPKLT